MSSIHPSSLTVGCKYISVKRVGATTVTSKLGAFVRGELLGRVYDPDLLLFFTKDGKEYSFVWSLGFEEFYEDTASG